MTVTAAEANRTFSALLRRIRAGRSVVITSHGRPVARMVPMTEEDQVSGAARTSLFKRLRGTTVKAVPRWTRDELYD